MTSLEGIGYGSAEQRKRRSSHVFDCPWVTVNHPGLPSDRARNGHAVACRVPRAELVVLASVPSRNNPVMGGVLFTGAAGEMPAMAR